MKSIEVDLVIIGGGPAGLAAAYKASTLGIKDILLLERNKALGGILQQCIHDGFGLINFKKQLSGPEYAQRYIDFVKEQKINYKLNTMVLDIDSNKNVIAANKEDGLLQIKAKSIILAMGCRERTKNQVQILGTRPKGVLTAGTVQRYINIEGYLPGKRAVVLGSGDIGMIMVRRMLLEGMEVEGVYELMSHPGGLERNIYQCLIDYDIPLHLSTTVVKVHGNKNLEGVTVQKVDENRNLIENTRRYIPCDLLVLSVGLIPENELSNKANLNMSKSTRGPIIDNNMMSSVEGIFACGNVINVFDLVDYVSFTSDNAANGAFNYIKKANNYKRELLDIIEGDNVKFLVPQKLDINNKEEKISLYFRSSKTIIGAVCTINDEKGNVLLTKKLIAARPAEMVKIDLDTKLISNFNKIIVNIGEAKK